MEFKGTKGKWSVERKEDTVYDQEVFAISTPTNEEFITVWNGVDIFEEAQEANALLISKAPEMLEMLRKLTQQLHTYSQIWGHDESKLIGDSERLIKEATEL